MAIHYDDLTESKKRELKEIALSMGYGIECTTDDEVKEFYRSILERDEKLRKKIEGKSLESLSKDPLELFHQGIARKF